MSTDLFADQFVYSFFYNFIPQFIRIILESDLILLYNRIVNNTNTTGLSKFVRPSIIDICIGWVAGGSNCVPLNRQFSLSVFVLIESGRSVAIVTNLEKILLKHKKAHFHRQSNIF